MPICLKFAAPGLLGEVMKVTGMVMVPTPEPWIVMRVLTVPAPCGASDWLTQIGNPSSVPRAAGRGRGLAPITPVVVRFPRAIACVTVRSLKDAHGAEPGMVAVTTGIAPPVAYTCTNRSEEHTSELQS